MPTDQPASALRILLVNDNEDDILLDIEAFRETSINADMITAPGYKKYV